MYWTINADGERLEDPAWSYPASLPEIPEISNLVAFFNERVDIIVDGVPQDRPKSRWS